MRRMTPGLGDLPRDFALYQSPGSTDPLSLARFSRRVEFYGQLQRGLKKVDMASMYHSLEVRVPLLDKEVIEFALSIDPEYFLNGLARKSILRELLCSYVPAQSIPRSKRGFAVPLGMWLRTAWKDVCVSTLFDGPLYPDGVFHRPSVERYWAEHQSGARDNKWGLWTILTLQWWAQTHLAAAGKPHA